MTWLQAETVRLGDLLRGKSFVIPAFQRGYAWGPEQVQALLDDIFSPRYSDLGNYFLGAVVLEQESPNRFRVVDGQQRLVTASLLLAALAVKNPALKSFLWQPSGEPVLQLRNRDLEVYGRLLKEPAKARKSTPLGQAMVILRDFLEHQTAKSQKKLAFTLLEQCELVRIVAPDGGRAFQIFETLNQRGLELSSPDLTKNKFLWSATDEALPEVTRLWGQLEDLLGDELPRFLRHFWCAFVEPISQAQLYEAVRRHLDARAPDQVLELTRALWTSAQHYQVLLNPDDPKVSCPARARRPLELLKAFGAKTCRPLLLLGWRLYPQELSWLARLCEVITVRSRLLTGSVTPSALESAYARTCRLVRERLALELGVSDFDAFGVTALMALNSAVLAELGPLVVEDKKLLSGFKDLRLNRLDQRWRTFLSQLLDLEQADQLEVRHLLATDLPNAHLKALGISRAQSQRWLHSPANMTFVESGGSLEQSSLEINHSLTKEWDLESLKARQAELAERLLRRWPNLKDLGL